MRQPKSTGNRSQYLNNNPQQQFKPVSKPPRGGKQFDDEPTSSNQNYRKVFKPNQTDQYTRDSVENTNDIILNGGA